MNDRQTVSVKALLPILFGFFVMGFCDIAGVATSYVKDQFQWSEFLAGFVPSMVLGWFLILATPAAVLMNRIGRKKTVQLSYLITVVGMLVPLAAFNSWGCILGLALLGVGNTILQVSLNPLLSNVLGGQQLTSALTAGQVVKALSSFCGPFIAMFSARLLGHWMYMFPIFAGAALLAGIWLQCTAIREEPSGSASSVVRNPFLLLKDRTILMLFLGIFFVVGVDVGTNTLTPKLLMERCSLPVDEAGLGSSVYFLCRTVGAFVGAFLLTRLSDLKYFRIHILVALVFVLLLFPASTRFSILLAVGGVGFFCSSIFSILFAIAIKVRPEQANEISGLLVTGIFGGAVIPPLMGLMTDLLGSQAGSLVVILCCVVYLTGCAFGMKPKY